MKKITASLIILILIASLIYVFKDSLFKNINFTKEAHVQEIKDFNHSNDYIKKLSILYAMTLGIHSISNLKSADNFKQIINISEKKLHHYSDIITRLNEDPDLKSKGIHPIPIYLNFLNLHNHHQNQSVIKNMVEIQSRKIARKHFEKPIRRLTITNYIKKPKKKKIKKRTPNGYQLALTTDSYEKGVLFLQKNQKKLDIIEKKYGVSKEYITAILFIETRLGNITGDKNVLSIYNSLYHYNNSLLFKTLLEYNKNQEESKLPSIFLTMNQFLHGNSNKAVLLPISSMKAYINESIRPRPGRSKIIYDRKGKKRVIQLPRKTEYLDEIAIEMGRLLKKRKDWSYKQIKSLILMDQQYNVDINTLNGSWAGAFGYCQFIPSSFLHWAKDGDSDGKINLYDFDDAFASVGNYLKDAGFEENKKKKILRSILRYNQSWKYVNTVNQYALVMKQRLGKSVTLEEEQEIEKAESGHPEKDLVFPEYNIVETETKDDYQDLNAETNTHDEAYRAKEAESIYESE